MAIGGIERVVYRVEDLKVSSELYEAFGLTRVPACADEVVFRLEEGSAGAWRSG